MMLCQQNPYVQEIRSEVKACEAWNGGYRIQLANSIFYPEGGGQPADTGWISAARVLDVQKEGEVVWHYVRSPVDVGAVTVKIDWKRRLDHMQQHTGQHLLTATIVNGWGWPTVGFHLGEKQSTIDLEVPSIAKETLKDIEEQVNKAIIEDAKVVAKVITADEYYNDKTIRSRGLPKGFQGLVRLIEISGVDLNTCGGTHLSSLRELQCCKILKTEKVGRCTRLSFLFGERVRHWLEQCLQRERELTSIFNQGVDEHVSLASKWRTERKELGRSLKKYQQELATHLGKELLAGNPTTLYRPDADIGMLMGIANQALALDPDCVFAVSGDGVFLIHSPNATANKDHIFSIVDGKGGGKPPRLQGKCSLPQRIDEVAKFL